MATTRLKIATGIVNVYTAGRVDRGQLCQPRRGIARAHHYGAGNRVPLVLKPQGVQFHKPLTRLRETIEVVQALIRGEAVTFTGETIQVTAAKLEMTPLRRHIPLYLGVTGPKALELAGEKGDGVILNAFLPTSYVERASSSRGRGEARRQKLGGGRH